MVRFLSHDIFIHLRTAVKNQTYVGETRVRLG